MFAAVVLIPFYLFAAADTSLTDARNLIQRGGIENAERLLRVFLETHKDSAEAHFLLGYALFRKKEAKASLAEYTEGARYQTPRAADLEAVAGDYVLLKDYPDADKWFSKAVEFNPTDSLGWYYLGRTKYNENRFEEAVTAFQTCLRLDAGNVNAEDNLGLSYEGLNQLQKAETAYRTALEWQSGRAPDALIFGPYLNLGALLTASGKPDGALPYLLEAEKIAPGEYRVHRQLGKTYLHLLQIEPARAQLEKAAALAPENAPLHYLLAQVYRKQGLDEKARAEEARYTVLNGMRSTPDN